MKRILLALTVATFYCFSCEHMKEDENHHYTIRVTNKTDKLIYIGGCLEPPVDQSGQDRIPFTGGLGVPKEYWIPPGETNTEALRVIRPTGNYERKLSGGYAVRLYFMDAETFDKIPSGGLTVKDALLESRVYSLEDLQKIDFHIIYP